MFVVGSNNVINLSNFKSNGIKFDGSSNKLFRVNVTNSNSAGLCLKGSKNIVNLSNFKSNKYGLFFNGSSNVFIQNVIRSNSEYGIAQVASSFNNINYNNIVNKKYNFILTKGSGNYNYNWGPKESSKN